MNKKLIKIAATIIFLITITSCKNTAFDPEYRVRWMKENVKFLKHPNFRIGIRKPRGSEYFDGPEAGCALEKMGVWEFDEKWGWGRNQTWAELNTNFVLWSGIALDHSPEDNSSYITKRNAKNPSDPWATFIYIGPWQYVSKIGKEIRFVATQSRNYGGIGSFFESKTPENSKIPAMPEIKLARSPEMNLDYCKVLWVKTYGYNAIIDIELNYPIGIFTGQIMKGSGKIIEADE